jgi:hypothetical protein
MGAGAARADCWLVCCSGATLTQGDSALLLLLLLLLLAEASTSCTVPLLLAVMSVTCPC